MHSIQYNFPSCTIIPLFTHRQNCAFFNLSYQFLKRMGVLYICTNWNSLLPSCFYGTAAQQFTQLYHSFLQWHLSRNLTLIHPEAKLHHILTSLLQFQIYLYLFNYVVAHIFILLITYCLLYLLSFQLNQNIGAKMFFLYILSLKYPKYIKEMSGT